MSIANADIDRQLRVIAERTVDLVSGDELRAKLERAAATRCPLRVKYGADPSAPDIHLGHVVGLNKLREFQDLGHTVVFIIGDFTGMIGDPSGRSETRKPLSREQIQAHARSYQEQAFRILDPGRTEVRFNSEWCAGMRFEDVLKLAAKVTVSQLLARDDFQQRRAANSPISLMEFVYPLVQAYDSVMIDADVELGGTDQLFNLLAGRNLQKAFGKPQQVALTMPLLEGLDGERKMSKSLGNYVGVSEPPREMFGKLMSLPDDLMWRYFRLVLRAPDSEIEALRLETLSGARHPRQVKEDLAKAVVTLFHPDTPSGAEGAAAFSSAAEDAARAFALVFSEHQQPDDMPAVVISPGQLSGNKAWIVSLLTTAGLAESNAAARRLIEQGAVRVNDARITDVRAQIELGNGCVLRAGKRGFARILKQ